MDYGFVVRTRRRKCGLYMRVLVTKGNSVASLPSELQWCFNGDVCRVAPYCSARENASTSPDCAPCLKTGPAARSNEANRADASLFYFSTFSPTSKSLLQQVKNWEKSRHLFTISLYIHIQRNHFFMLLRCGIYIWLQSLDKKKPNPRSWTDLKRISLLDFELLWLICVWNFILIRSRWW